jgi:hypothetical protein
MKQYKSKMFTKGSPEHLEGLKKCKPFKGVTFSYSRNTYSARTKIKGRSHFLGGAFNTPEEAYNVLIEYTKFNNISFYRSTSKKVRIEQKLDAILKHLGLPC